MKIFLCGYMGGGKSTVGKVLSQHLELLFFDLDDEISKSEGAQVSEMFNQKGEIYFRRKEREKLIHFLETKNDIILALGGGTPCYGDNLKLIKEKDDVKLVYLQVSPEYLSDRLYKEKHQRPLIAHIETPGEMLDFVRKHLFERNYYYSQSNIIIKVEGKNPQEIAQEITFKLT